MKKFEYKEPEFKVVVTSTQDVITTSNPDTYTLGAFETGITRLGGPVIGL
ncbi:MAG: hypothetical protein IJS03_08660 [Eubacterium sp.]|nr:hypothetical protein [Eubacterium sp.]